MATQLQLYNIALRCIGASPLETMTEDVEKRRALDASGDQALEQCLRAGFWNFAMRVTERQPDATDPAFNYTYAYTKPTDWVRTRNISSSQTLRPDLKDFQDQNGFWLCHVSPLYVRYVSNDANYGSNLSLWPSDYTEFVGAYLGSLVILTIGGHSIVGSSRTPGVIAQYEQAVLKPRYKRALANDAIDGPAEQRELGSWASARRGSSGITFHGGFMHIGG